MNEKDMQYILDEFTNDDVIRLYLSDETTVDIWYDYEQDSYIWSNTAYGYNDLEEAIDDLKEWLEENNVSVMSMETL